MESAVERGRENASQRSASGTRTRKIVIAGILGSISVLLGATHLGFIPWVTGASLTIMHVPVIIGAVLEGPVAGAVIGLIFGVFSLLQAAIAPAGPADVWFVNPVVSVLPRLCIGPVAWLVYRGLRRMSEIPALAASGVCGSLTNTVLVLGALGAFKFLPWKAIGTIAAANGIPEAVLAASLTVAVVASWKRIKTRRRGSRV
ncbi:MAG: ECF transporter S component [Spirochaetota bacterium]